MKKIVLALALLLTLNAGTGFAAPINDLANGQTAAGIVRDTVYLEHKFSNSFTFGYQDIERYTGKNDIYGQLDLSGNLRGIIGSRNFDSGSKLYLGMAVNGPIAPEWDGYASLIAGSEFKEMQIGANFKLAHNVDLNLNYRSFMPDFGSNKNDVGIGATFKF